MINTHETKISKHPLGKKLTVTRAFNATADIVWRAWTESALLDQWWAPRPWKAVTKSMDFNDGGFWLYYMAGPQGEKHWCRADYKNIMQGESYEALDAFCDETGTPTNDLPGMQWLVQFAPVPDGTLVTVEITFDSEESLEKIIEMGFKEGFTMAHGNLDELLATL